MKIDEIIDSAKAAANIESDIQFSKYLGLSKSAVANWRAGTSHPNTVACERLAGLSGIPLAKVLGIVGEARAISREEKAVWRKLAASAAAVIMFVGAALPQHAEAKNKAFSANSAFTSYALCEIRRKIPTWIQELILWLGIRWRRKKPGPDNLEAFAA